MTETNKAKIPVLRQPYENTDGDKLANYAKTLVGTPHQWGGDTPGVGLDSAGLINHVYAAAGQKVGTTTWEQIQHGTGKALGQVVPGDVIFQDPNKSNMPDQASIYIGGGLHVAAIPGQGVTIQRVSQGGRIMAVRSYGAKSTHPTAPEWLPPVVPKNKSLAVGYPPAPGPSTASVGRIQPTPAPSVMPSG